ncbi:MAG: FHA domain-containing protein [Gammaproteobacteria bacterium]|nr:FHA domain-containing protein [Gammaproteobacteria bacterium]
MGSSASWRLVRQGEHAPFEVSGDTIVGRSKQADLCLQEGFVSRRHARLWLESGRLMVEDLGSANGTFVNGERLTKPMRLAPGDCVTFDAFDYFVEAIAPRLRGDPNATEDPNATGLELPDDEDDSGIEDFNEQDVTGQAQFESQPPPQPPPPPPNLAVTQPMNSAKEEPALPLLDDPDFDLDFDDGTAPGFGNAGADPDISDFDLTGQSATLPPPGQDRPAGQPMPPPSTLSPVVHAPDQPPPSVLAATVDMSTGESPAVRQTQIMESTESGALGSGAVDPAAPALLATSGPLEGSLIHLEPGRILLGRGVECDIWIDHPAVSRQHLEIFLSEGRCRIRQLEGARGAMLNGNPVGDAELIPGDVLRVGTVEFVYDSIQSLTQTEGGLPPWVWMLVGFMGAGAILAGLFMFVL